MLIYGFWEALNFMCSQIKQDRKRTVTFLSCILWLLLAFRSMEMGLYDTKDIYYISFNTMSTMNFKELLTSLSIVNEPLMKMITWGISHITDNFQIYLVITSFISIYAVRNLLIEENKDPVFGLAIYFGLFFFYNTFLIKQMMAISFILYSYKYLKKRNLAKFILFVMIATLIHKTSIFFIFVYPLCKYIKFKKIFFLIIGGLLGIGVFAPDFILNLIYKLPFYNFKVYLKYGVYSYGQESNFSIFFYIILMIFCYYLKRYNNETDYNDLLILSFIGCVLNSWSTIVVEFYRMALDFNVFYCILLPYSISGMSAKNRKIVRILLLLMMYGYAFKIALNTHSLTYIPCWKSF